MTMSKRLCDPLGRSATAAPRIALALCVAAVISGSAWPIQARSVRPSVDTKRRRTYEKARRRNPQRWSGTTRNWTPTGPVMLNPRRQPNSFTHARQAA